MKKDTHSSSSSGGFSSWTVPGGGGRSSIGNVSSGGVGGVLSNSAIGASSGIGDTEFESIIGGILTDFQRAHPQDFTN